MPAQTQTLEMNWREREWTQNFCSISTLFFCRFNYSTTSPFW